MHLVGLAVDRWLMLGQLLEDLGSLQSIEWPEPGLAIKSQKMQGKGTLRTCGTLFQIRASSLAVVRNLWLLHL